MSPVFADVELESPVVYTRGPKGCVYVCLFYLNSSIIYGEIQMYIISFVDRHMRIIGVNLPFEEAETKYER